jgi:hypothetical protein
VRDAIAVDCELMNQDRHSLLLGGAAVGWPFVAA